MNEATEPAPTIAVRACAAIVEGNEICLIHRYRPDGDQYSLPGGLLHPNEEVPNALARELKEELDLNVTSLPDQPKLCWVQDQTTTRPGSNRPFRRIHLIHVVSIPRDVRHTMATCELDADDRTRVVWIPVAKATAVHLYPAAGEALRQLANFAAPPSHMMLPPITDQTYDWR
ncbi:NUDIX hydrolase [Streptomyces sp. AK02-01A]|uniref:NUDIX hydrolase n=1 Tax=Streptomyces sp. AK02-01A TaxID=3028648 RepID=UPI0029A68F1F|nr:NUDIX hydrolase [Streptomyces sp. AK02-01A]MDX3855784.1 NUDIX hydrolase [Streptomyces sp. AK02-01A]